MKDFLIVFPKENKSISKKLVSKLKTDGYSCWVPVLDYKLDDKASVVSAASDSKILLMVIDKTITNNNEIKQALSIAMEHGLEIIPFVIEKIESNLYSDYFFNKLSWIDAYDDSFDEAYELLTDAHKELTGEHVSVKKANKKRPGEQKIKPVHYALIAIVLIILGYIAYQALSDDAQSEILVGRWNLSDYKDNLVRTPQDSISMIQGLLNMRNNMKLVFNDDHTFERIGFPEGPTTGKWELNKERTILYLEPIGSDKKDIVNVEKLTETEFTFSVKEVIGTNTVSTIISFTKQNE